jgi:hypothetical protein
MASVVEYQGLQKTEGRHFIVLTATELRALFGAMASGNPEESLCGNDPQCFRQRCAPRAHH